MFSRFAIPKEGSGKDSPIKQPKEPKNPPSKEQRKGTKKKSGTDAMQHHLHPHGPHQRQCVLITCYVTCYIICYIFFYSTVLHLEFMESSRSSTQVSQDIIELFFYLFFKVSSWQSMRNIYATSLDELRNSGSSCCTRAMQNCHCPDLALLCPNFQWYP